MTLVGFTPTHQKTVMEQLQHDPRSKQQIKDALYAFLYDPVQVQFKNRIDLIITRNAILGGFSHRHFMYKGDLYNSESTHPPLNRNRLLPQLRADMEDYLKDVRELNNNELPYVLGFINQVLNSSNDLQDYLKILPESVHHPLHQLIDTCPCKTAKLTAERIQQIQDKNQEPIDLMKRRMVINLLI